MRTSLGRLTLRGARAVAASATSRNAPPLAPLAAYAARELCSTTAVSADTKRKSEQESDGKDPDRIVVLPDQQPHQQHSQTPAVHVLTTDAEVPPQPLTLDEDLPVADVSPLVRGAVVQSSEESSVSDAGTSAGDGVAPARGPNVKTPEQMLKMMRDHLRRNATRAALFHYAAAFKVEQVPSIDEDVMKLMLPVLGRNAWATTAADTINLAIERGYDLGIGAINCGLHAMARAGMAEEISNLLEAMWQKLGESNPNATSYNYLIGAHIYAGNVDNAFNVLNEMKKHLIYPTFATYHALITGCLRRRDPRRAYQTLMAVEKQRFDISAMTVAQVLVASASNDDYDHVITLLAKLEESLPRYGDELHRIAEFRALYRLKDSQRTTKADRDTLRGQPRPEIGAISAVLHCAFRGGRVDIASRAWMIMEEYYPDFDVPLPLYYCLIGAYAGAGDFSQAIDIVGAMREKGHKLSMRDLEMSLVRPLAYDVSVIDEQFYRLCDRKDGKEPGEQGSASSPAEVSTESESAPIDEAADEGSEPHAEQQTVGENSADLSNAVPDGPEAVDRPDEVDSEIKTKSRVSPSLADALLAPQASTAGSSIAEQFKPTTVGIEELNCIIAACSASHDLDRAFQTFDEVETRFGLERNIDTYNALLEGCVQTRRLSGGMRVLEEIESVGLAVSGYTLHLAARLMLRAARSDEVSALLKKAHSQGDSVLLQTYQMVLRHFVRGDRMEAALDVWQQAGEAGFNFNAVTGRLDAMNARKMQQAVSGETSASEADNAEDVREEAVGDQDGFPGDDTSVEETKEGKQ